MNRHGAIFDMDGTLIDTATIYYEVFAKILQENDAQNLMPDQQTFRQSYFGKTAQAIFEEICANTWDLEKIIEKSHELYVRAAVAFEQAETIPDVPGIRRILDFFVQNGIPMAVASSSELPAIVVCLQKTGMLHYFQNIISGHHLTSKPSPDIFLVASMSIDRTPELCVVFEDSLPGMKGAKVAGMGCIGIATSKTVQEMINADIALNHYDDLDLAEISRILTVST